MFRSAFRAFATLATLVLAWGHAAWADAIQDGATLILTGAVVQGSDDDSFEIIVAPDGEVTIFGVTGVGAADGKTFSGITQIIIDTGVFGNDDIAMQIESSDIAVEIGTGTFGNDSVTIDLTVPPGAAAGPGLGIDFDIDTGLRDDKLEMLVTSFSDDLMLDLTTAGVEQAKLELDQGLGTAAITLSGGLGDLIAGGGADFAVDGSVASSLAKVEIEGDLTSDLTVQSGRFGSIALVVKGDLTGAPQLLAATDIKVEVDGDATGDARLTGDAFSSNLEYVVKGNLTGFPKVTGRGFPDSLKLLVDGAIDGRPVLDGGGGFPDSCDASPGVTVVGCD